MKREVTVALIQGGPRLSDVRANMKHNLEAIDEAAGSGPDFITFDELSTTPYFPAAARDDAYFRWAEPIPGAYVAEMGKKAREHSCSIVVPVFELSADGYYNSAAVLGPDGRLIEGKLADGRLLPRYAKVHIPTVRSGTGTIDEKVYFRPGPGFAVFDTPKAKVGVAICYDRRFPESVRSLALRGAELVFVPGNFPLHSALSPELHFAETRTRASENHVFVVSCNKAGVETVGGATTTFLGRSCVAAPDGTFVGETGSPDRAELVTARLDMSAIGVADDRVRLLDDRRPKTYGSLV